KPVAETKDPAIATWNLNTPTPLRLATGENGPLHGNMRDVQILRSALSDKHILQLKNASPPN
ncbi:MAG: hypothetical protein ACKOS8_12405, partial [Gemmataceae bacterium]